MSRRILSLFPRAVDGGAERLVFDQMRLHDSAACELFVIALRQGYLNSQYRPFSEYSCLNARVALNPFALWKLHRFVRERKIELLHTHLQEADFYGYFLKLTNPGLVWISTRHNTDRFRTRVFWRALNSRMARRVDHVVAVSNAVKEFVCQYEHIDPPRVCVVYNGVDTRLFAPKAPAVALRESLGIEQQAFVLGIVGRLTPQKGHRYLFEAVARIARDAPRLHVLVVGKGNLAARLRRLAGRLRIGDRVSFAGYRDNMPEMYSVMDAVCVPSIFEGFGLVVVEAMLCGKIVIGTRIDGIKEIVADGVNGLLVPAADAERLAEALRCVYGKTYDSDLASRARRMAIDQFDIRNNLERIERLYLRLTEREITC